MVMGVFNKHPDPYIEFDTQVMVILEEFEYTYHKTKEENKRLNENLDYSASLDGSGLMCIENMNNSPDHVPNDDDEFNINMLDSTHNQPAPQETTPERKPPKQGPTRSQIMNNEIKELREQVRLKDEQIKGFGSTMVFEIGPKAAYNSKDYSKLKQQLLDTENELSKKTLLFEQECNRYKKKVED